MLPSWELCIGHFPTSDSDFDGETEGLGCHFICFAGNILLVSTQEVTTSQLTADTLKRKRTKQKQFSGTEKLAFYSTI